MRAKRNAGFSLAEIVVVVSIIMLMSSLILARIPALRMQTRVSASAENMKRAILEARRRSTSIVEFKVGSGVFPSYGVYFDTATPDRLTIFADCKLDDNGDLNISEQDYFSYNQASANCPAPNSNGFVENIFLEQGITIKALRTFDSNPMSGTTRTIGAVEYLRPEPSIWISHGNSPSTLIGLGGLAIDIADATNSYKKTIVIWITGNIEVL